MRRQDWIVTEKAARPAGKPGECFYCHAKVGNQHNEGCVNRCRTVVVRLSIDYVRDVPEHWDPEVIESHGCSDNHFREIAAIVEAIDKGELPTECLCPMRTRTYLREATEEDEERLGIVRVADMECE